MLWIVIALTLQYVFCNLLGRIFAKWLLFILNGLCIVISVCTCGFAIVDLSVLKQYGEGQATGTFSSDLVIVMVCVLLITIAIFGCYGTVKENAKILWLYIGLLMLFIVLELLVAVYVAVERRGLQLSVAEWITNDFFRNVTKEELPEHRKLWDNLQTTFACCGLNGPEDYQAIKQPISLSCCLRAFRAKTAYAQQQLYQTCLESKTYFMEGCEDEILYILTSDADWLIGVTLICLTFELTGIIAAMWLADIKKRDAQPYNEILRY